MSLNQKVAKLYRRLRQEPNRWQGLFKSTHFDRLVRKHVEETKQKHRSLGTCPEQFIVSGIVAQALKSDSQRDFIDTLTKEGIWRTVCGFQKSLPDQSTFSRKWNNETYLFALEGVFAGLRQLVVMKQLPGELKYSPPILQALQHGYIPFLTDGTHISLSSKRFDFASRGYASKNKKREFGAKLHLTTDGLLTMPVAFTATEGKDNGSELLDDHLTEIGENWMSWFKNRQENSLTLLSIFDKGYWNVKRFWRLTAAGTCFICPKKKGAFKNDRVDQQPVSASAGDLKEFYIWHPGTEKPLRWISMKRKKNSTKYWELLTNILDLPAATIIALYKLRWKIEEFFKCLKHLLGLRRPLVESWVGFVQHLYFNLLLMMLLIYMLTLLGLPKWQTNILELKRLLVKSPEQPWSFNTLRIPLGSRFDSL